MSDFVSEPQGPKAVVFVDLATDETLEPVRSLLEGFADELVTEPRGDVSFVYQTAKAGQIARLLGPSAKRRALEALIAPRVAQLLTTEGILSLRAEREGRASGTEVVNRSEKIQLERADRGTVWLSHRVQQLCSLPSTLELAAELAEHLCNPLLHDSALRAMACDGIMGVDRQEALGIFAGILQTTHGRHGHHEARAIGSLLAAKTTRYSHRSPFAIELVDPREEWTRELHRLATQLGEYEQLFDERGYTVHRIRSDEPPNLARLNADTVHPLRSFLEALQEWNELHLWLAGVRLTADLPWSQWCAILGQ